ncbi:universal stress protein [Ramlibacter sp. AW1]|uniref:Universal stress protein n=1 Tax=Ramlibacter aurantiacus TaxID=2801330 RepID=A0A936ZT92_9BURK|nr:universal stress protein [Ramlibacter aurantiacus]MBL0422141.1 universal stress protein [Ramlibacter aurantiacus]
MYQRILVPIDGSDASLHALDTAIGLARAFKAQLRLIHVLEDAAYLAGYDPAGAAAGELYQATRESGEQIVKDAAARVQAAGLQAETLFVDRFGDRLPDAIATAAKDWGADLIVVGTHGRRGLSRLMLGSGAEQIIRTAPVPVLVARQRSH